MLLGEYCSLNISLPPWTHSLLFITFASNPMTHLPFTVLFIIFLPSLHVCIAFFPNASPLFPSPLSIWRASVPEIVVQCCDGDFLVCSTASDFGLWSNQFSLILKLFLALFPFVSCLFFLITFHPLLFLQFESRANR